MVRMWHFQPNYFLLQIAICIHSLFQIEKIFRRAFCILAQTHCQTLARIDWIIQACFLIFYSPNSVIILGQDGGGLATLMLFFEGSGFLEKISRLLIGSPQPQVYPS